MSHSLRKVLSLAALIIAAGGLPVASAVQAAPVPPPSRSSAPSRPGSPVVGSLNGVAASGTGVWAVGASQHSLIQHWNGTAWTNIPSPSPGFSSMLNGAASISPASAWAAGSFCPPGPCHRSRELILRWNGTSWSRATVPSASADGFLSGMSATSGSDVWAVGAACHSNLCQNLDTLTLHWNGTAWSRIPSPSPGPGKTGELSGVTAISPTDAWAVGTIIGATGRNSLILHWNGTAWSQVNSPRLGSFAPLYGVAGNSASDVWAVGTYCPTATCTSQRMLILHWNGTAWSRIPTSSTGKGHADVLNSVAATSATDAWAVGYYCANVICRGPGGAILLHWNGTAWSRVQSPVRVGVPVLSSVTAISASDAWAVGSASLSTLILHWNGSTWSKSAIPSTAP